MLKLFQTKRSRRESLIKRKAARMAGNTKPAVVRKYKAVHMALASGK